MEFLFLQRLSMSVLLLLLPALPDLLEKSAEVVLKETFAFTFSSSFNPLVDPPAADVVVRRVFPNSSTPLTSQTRDRLRFPCSPFKFTVAITLALVYEGEEK